MDDQKTGWYLVFTKPHHENIAKDHLQRQGFQSYLPLLQQHKRRRNLYQIITEPLFPRYLFIHLNSNVGDWSKIRSTRGCISLVRFGTLPARVPNKLIEKLQQEESQRVLDDSQSIPEFKQGEKVQVIDGVFANYEGIVDIKNNQQRIALLLTIAEGHTRCVNLSVHQIRKIPV